MLHVENLIKTYAQPGGDRVPILWIENWRVGDGEQVALLGPSGSGKTTLLQILAGLSLPDSGKVIYDRHDITRLNEIQRDHFRARAIGFVFQTLNLLDGFSALENVMLGMTFGRRRADRARAKEQLERVGLGHRLDNTPDRLSIGERQRVAVARALVGQPRVILADEPTAHLDPRNQQQVLELIRTACKQQNVALIMVTHATEVASQFDRVESLEQFNRAMNRTDEDAAKPHQPAEEVA